MALIDPPLYLQADAHPARTFRQLITAMLAEGILGSTSFAVSQRAAGGANFSVDVAAGMAVVKGDSATQQGHYLVVNDATITNDAQTAVTSAPTAGNTRYDIVVLEIKDNAEDAGGLNLPRLRVIAGTPLAAGAVPPAVPNTCLLLATIGPIVNSTTSITNSLIVDGRVASRLAHDVVSNSSVTTLKIADLAVTTAKLADSAVTGAKIADGTIVSSKISDGTIVNSDISSAAPGWLTLPLASGIVPAGGLEYPAYTKFGNLVIVSGACRRSTSGSDIGTLPAGYRPPTLVAGVASRRDGTSMMVQIDTSGLIQTYGTLFAVGEDASFYAMFRTV